MLGKVLRRKAVASDDEYKMMTNIMSVLPRAMIAAKDSSRKADFEKDDVLSKTKHKMVSDKSLSRT